MSRTDDVPGLLAFLRESTSGAFEKARPLPAAAYHSRGLADLELSRIFAKEWTCVGRVGEIPDVGCYLTSEILGEPVLTIRGADGEIRSFVNVCLHRMAQLLEGRGRCERIVCPYHAWTYDTEGRLTNAPLMNRTTGFETKGRALHALRTEIWESFIYVSLDPESQSIAARLGPLSEILAGYGIADFVDVHQLEEVWDTNWKCLCENFMESYHVFKVHAKSFEPATPTSTTECHPGGDAYNVHFQYAREEWESRLAPAENTALEGDLRRRVVISCVYPAHLISITPRSFWHLSLQPEGPECVRVRAGFAASPHALEGRSPEEHWKEVMAPLYEVAIPEDREIVGRIARGTRSRIAQPGPFHVLESAIWDFYRYLDRRLGAGDVPAAKG